MKSTKEKYAILCQRGRERVLGFWDALRISGTAEAINHKFGMQIDHEGYQQKKMQN